MQLMQSNTFEAHMKQDSDFSTSQLNSNSAWKSVHFCLTSVSSVSVFQATNHARGQFHFLSQQLGGCFGDQENALVASNEIFAEVQSRNVWYLLHQWDQIWSSEEGRKSSALTEMRKSRFNATAGTSENLPLSTIR